jgi:histidyl-tRNA synthetase
MKFQAIKGVRDILPPDSALWNRVEQSARDVFSTYGYGEIRLPIFEQTELFARSIGVETDVVSKEMYSFEDHDLHLLGQLISNTIADTKAFASPIDAKYLAEDLSRLLKVMDEDFCSKKLSRTPSNDFAFMKLHAYCSFFGKIDQSTPGDEFLGILLETRSALEGLELGDHISLRPEATASVVRAYIQHGMQTRPGNVKLYYIGPMFRRERPQKGRYRQFYQIGVELLGQSDHPALDAEVIEMLLAFFARIGLQGTALNINSIGDKECRPKYVEQLRTALHEVKDKLGPDSQRRIETNPLRVLDSKLPEEQPIIEKLPRIAEHLCDACREHYAELKRQLNLRGINYQENWRLVRGLDYYMRTTFEVTAKGLGSQDAVCGGGRYDGLVELLGGPAGTKGIGFAIGTDRVILSLEQSEQNKPKTEIDVYLAWMGAASYPAAVSLAQKLRRQGTSVELPAQEMKFGKSLNLADRLGASYAVILGENEIASGEITVKRFTDGDQKKLSEHDLLTYLLPKTQ